MKLVQLALVMAVGGGLVYGGVQLSNSPALSLRTIELAGGTQGKLTVSQVMKAGRITKGRNLLKFSTGEAARRIETLPWVLSARVERIYPSKLRIKVVERTPTVVAEVGGSRFLVDNEGVVLEQGDAGLIHISELPLEGVVAGDRIKLIQFVHSMRILASLPPALRERLNSLRARTLDRITLELTDGTIVIYGAADQLAAKNYAAQKLLERYDGEGKILATVDVRAPSRPAVLVKP